jgi:hypothetical protein
MSAAVNRTLKRILIGFGSVVGGTVALLGGYAAVQARAFDASLDKVYDLPVPALAHVSDPAVIARGKHLAESIAACAARDCHGGDLGGGKLVEIGPIGRFQAPNITTGGLGVVYSDGEIARLIRHGVKKDGRGVRFMPAHEFNWLPDSDVVALISYLRSLPSVDRPNGPMQVGVLAKVLDRRDVFPMDVARRIDHSHIETAPPPSPTPEYGRFLTRLCSGCHGPHMSGGPIPGAPPGMPVPLNLTPHETGLKDWTYDDFVHTLTTGVTKSGRKLDPMMPFESLAKLDDVEMHALWAGLRGLPPMPLGNR